jgi:DNA-binding IclR family transcriptional regulator
MDHAPRFADRLVSVLNDGALCLMISVGHRTGLFDAMRDAPSLTSSGLAARAGLNERYVREWLGAMVTGRVVEVDPASLRYTLPADHAALLTRVAAADNLGAFTM